MKEYLKRMIQLGEITIINSLTPILTWVLLGFIANNKNLINIFSLTYSVQFLPYMFLALFVTGNIIGNKKKILDNGYIYSGIIVSNVIAFIVMLITTCNIENAMNFIGIKDQSYTNWFLYSLWFMFLQVPLTQILELLYFENKDNEAKKISFTFNLLYCATINIIYICIKNELLSVSISIFILAIYIYYQVIKQIKPFKFKFNVFKGTKYQLSVISSNLMMFIIYLFGMKSVFEYSPDFALAVSFCSILTDTQWDMIINSICTVSKVEISNGTCKIKELMSASKIYVMIMALSMWILLLFGYYIYYPKLEFVITILLIETIDMLFVQTRYVKQSWIDIEIRSKWSVYLVMMTKIIRMLISISGISIYALWIAQGVSGIVNAVGFNLLYKKYTKYDTLHYYKPSH